MSSITIGIFALISIFIGMLFFSYAGHRIALWQAKIYPNEKQLNNRIIEGAIFALMGLLIAFTFSGAKDRFDVRRALVIDEANAIENVYLRLDLLPLENQTLAKSYLRNYLNIRLAIYEKMPHWHSVLPELKQSELLQQKIWQTAVLNCQTASSSACIVLLPAINNMIDIANTRFESTRIHPPAVILFTLIGLALLSAALSGFNTHSKSHWLSLHVFVYSLIISFTIYIIINLEYPDRGFLRINYFNEVLIDVEHKLIGQ